MIYTHRFVPLFLFLHDVCKKPRKPVVSSKCYVSGEWTFLLFKPSAEYFPLLTTSTTKLQLYVLKLWIQTACAQTARSSQLLVLLMQWSSSEILWVAILCSFCPSASARKRETKNI